MHLIKVQLKNSNKKETISYEMKQNFLFKPFKQHLPLILNFRIINPATVGLKYGNTVRYSMFKELIN